MSIADKKEFVKAFVVLCVFIGGLFFLAGGFKSQKELDTEKVADAVAEQAEIDAYNQNIIKGLPVGCTLKYLGRYKMSKYEAMPITVVQCKSADVVTTNSSPSCGKYKCPEVNVNITTK